MNCRLLLITIISIIIIIVGLVIVSFNRSTQKTKSVTSEVPKTLKFVQIIFRHGDRTSLPTATYPNDPNRNYTYPPYGMGALTNDGKRHMYDVGRYLQQRYGTFLGDYYYPDVVKGTTSDSLRTQASLQLVLAGLFPPKEEQIWATSINWQPIPYQTIPAQRDKMFLSFQCPGYKQLYRAYMKTPEILKLDKNNQELYNCISLHTGANVTTLVSLIKIYDTLTIQQKFGLNLPKWTDNIQLEDLEKWSVSALRHFCATDRLKRLFAGYLLKHLLNEIHDKIDGKINQKVALYSGHDINIAGIGLTLNFLQVPIIPYGAYISIELHQIDNNHMLKWYYQDFNQPEPKIIKLLNGETLIPVDQYAKLIKKYLPEDEECKEGPDGIQHIYDF